MACVRPYADPGPGRTSVLSGLAVVTKRFDYQDHWALLGQKERIAQAQRLEPAEPPG
jgi:hypothetical protein